MLDLQRLTTGLCGRVIHLPDPSRPRDNFYMTPKGQGAGSVITCEFGVIIMFYNLLSVLSCYVTFRGIGGWYVSVKVQERIGWTVGAVNAC